MKVNWMVHIAVVIDDVFQTCLVYFKF